MQVQFLAWLSGLRIWHCCELWCRSQTQLEFHIAVAVASSSSSIWPLAWTPPYATHAALKSQKKKKKSTKGQNPTIISEGLGANAGNYTWSLHSVPTKEVGKPHEPSLLACSTYVPLPSPIYAPPTHLRNQPAFLGVSKGTCYFFSPILQQQESH